tara:strand:- start:450 stop:1718 length:1269 start_codon:yes stop_codon:yes gene_type:complete
MHSQLLSLFASTLFANTLFGNTLFGITLLFAASTPTLVAQLEVHGIKKLAELVVHTKSVLREQPAATGADLWHMMVAHLRLGQAHEARRLLLHYPDSKQPEFVLAAFATLQRTTGEDLLDSTRRRTLERALHRSEQLPFSRYCEAALQIHGRYCLAQLDEDAQRGQHERIATARLLALEGEAWQPGRGHYRPIPCGGQLLVPAPADASLLQPLTFGMLLASGDRLTKHLRNTVAAARSNSKLRWQATLPACDVAALLLTAAAQLGDDDAMREAFASVVQQRATDPGLAARNLNAAMQAITGVRLAAGGGLSPRWLRMTPWLPDGITAAELRGVLALTHEFTMSLQRGQTKSGLRVTVQLHQGKSTTLPLVVGNRWQQFVTEVRTDQPFECELPGAKLTPRKPLPSHSKADDDALRRFCLRCL